MVFELIIINGIVFKCDCGCISFKKVSPPEGEPLGDYYECQVCGSLYEKK